MPSRWRRLPHTLLGRLSAALIVAVVLSQLIGNAIWVYQSRIEADMEVTAAAQSVAQSAVGTVRFFLSLPPKYHPILIQQFRAMGGTRFFANINRAPVNVIAIDNQSRVQHAAAQVHTVMAASMPSLHAIQIAFTWPNRLAVSDQGVLMADLPESWVQHILLPKAKPAPVLVIQVELQQGHWLYLATLMPNPYFLDSGKLLKGERLLLQCLTLAFVLIVAILVVRWSTYPLALLSRAAEAIGTGGKMPSLPQHGSDEFVSTARAFSAMQKRIQGFIEDRERLFVSISHDLRTPIMRLKFRTELLDDEVARADFNEDLEELEMMVMGALQHVQDSAIHENVTVVSLDILLARIVRDARLGHHQVEWTPCGLSVTAKPLALKRAIGNLLDNALHYGTDVEIHVRASAGRIHIEIRDHGPGVPEAALATLFDAYVRLDHGRDRNGGGLGLGLGIARWLVQDQGGELLIINHIEGGLCATISLPA